MPTITFPASAFRANVQDYTNERGEGVDSCLWRELLQNSRDAGSRRVDATVSEAEGVITLTMRDNGRGMDRPTLERGLLTYAGSIKADGAAGGFGMAKCLLVFAPDSCEIKTREHHVKCTGIEYEWLNSDETVQGCEFKITITNPADMSKSKHIHPTVEGLKYLLARSDMRGMEVWCNGEFMSDTILREGEEVRNWESMKARAIHIKGSMYESIAKNTSGQRVVIVRHRGIWVMDLVHSEEVRGAVVIELDGEAAGLLNAARVSFANYSDRVVLDKFVGELARSPRQSLKTKKWMKRWDGAGLTTIRSGEDVARALARVLKGETVAGDGKGIVSSVSCDKGELIAALATEQADDCLRIGGMVDEDRLDKSLSVAELSHACQMMCWKPALMVVNEREQMVGEEYMPETMGKRIKAVLVVWAELVKQYLILNKCYCTYGVGFIFSEDALAQWRRLEDGTVWFLFNPQTDDGEHRYSLSSSDSRDEMIASAAHEVTHELVLDDYHGDRFAGKLTDLLAQTLKYGAIFNKIWKYRE